MVLLPLLLPVRAAVRRAHLLVLLAPPMRRARPQDRAPRLRPRVALLQPAVPRRHLLPVHPHPALAAHRLPVPRPVLRLRVRRAPEAAAREQRAPPADQAPRPGRQVLLLARAAVVLSVPSPRAWRSVRQPLASAFWRRAQRINLRPAAIPPATVTPTADRPRQRPALLAVAPTLQVPPRLWRKPRPEPGHLPAHRGARPRPHRRAMPHPWQRPHRRRPLLRPRRLPRAAQRPVVRPRRPPMPRPPLPRLLPVP